MMEVAKVTSKGQITIPISIRRKLEINEGDKVLFIYKPEGVLMVNPTTYQAGADNNTAEAAEAEAAAMTVKTPAKAAEPTVAAIEQNADSTFAEDAEVEKDVVPEVAPRPVPPPVEEPEKPEPNVGGLNLGSLLDDIRSIGSNI